MPGPLGRCFVTVARVGVLLYLYDFDWAGAGDFADPVLGGGGRLLGRTRHTTFTEGLPKPKNKMEEKIKPAA